MNSLRRKLFFIVCGLTFAGCAGTAAYKEPAAKFRAASASVISSSRNYILEANKVARDIYIEERVSGKQDIRLDKVYAQQPLSADGLALRLRALEELSDYAQLLYELAAGNEPAKLQPQFKDIGAAFKEIGKGLPAGSAGDFAKGLGPVSEAAGVIAREIAEDKIEAALRDAAKLAEGPVNELILAIREDVTAAYAQKRDFYSQQRVRAVDNYNNSLDKGESESSLRSKAEKLKAQLDLYEELTADDPRPGFDALLQANAMLAGRIKTKLGRMGAR